MTTPRSKSPERTPEIPGPIEQLYVMHCLKEDSVLGQEGFSVRAASPGANDPAIFEWALRLDYYELPLDMKSGPLVVNQAPRRLARVPGPSGRVALVHTSYLPHDTVGRSHSFLSQIALLPELPTLAAAAAWGSSEWQTREYPLGDSKVISPLDRVPRGSLIDQNALQEFLSSSTAPTDQSLARTIFPSRVESNPKARCRWLRATLQGFLRAIEPGSRKARLCILAEPGAVALLVYAIARLLPERIAGAFPFSTYEPHYTSLRDNKAARVIGSFARNGLDRGDLESLRRRGYVLDTLRNDEDPDLAVPDAWPLEGLITLAAKGEWGRVDEIRDLWSKDPRVVPGVSAVVLGEALPVPDLVDKLKNGTLTADGLLELAGNSFGARLLREGELRAPAWEAVRKVWSQPAIHRQFAELIREHGDELLAEVRGLVETGPPGAWRDAWEALKDVLPPERRANDFSNLLSAMEHTGAVLPATERAKLVLDWCQAVPATALFPAGLHWLLHAGSAEAFHTLLGSPKVSARLGGVATCQALCGAADYSADPAFLRDLPEDQFQAFATTLPRFENRKTVYDRLRSASASARVLVDRLIRVRSKLPDSCVEDLLSGLSCDEPAWHDFWQQGGGTNFAAMLELVAADSPLARRIWDGLIVRLRPESVLDGEAASTAALAGIAGRYPSSLSREQLDRLEAWNSIAQEFASPSTKLSPTVRAANLASACRAVDVKREDLAAQWFDSHILTASSPADLKEESKRFGNALLGFFESEDAACACALKLANGVEKRELRRRCITALFQAIVSGENHDRLASKFESFLRETDIRPAPEVDLLQRGTRGGRAGKGLGFGRHRLPARWTPYIMTFTGGMAAGALLVVALMPWLSNIMSAASGSKEQDQNTRAVNATDELKSMLEDERTRAGEIRAELESKVRDLELKLSQAQPAGETKSPAPGKGQPKAAETADGKQPGDQKPNNVTLVPPKSPAPDVAKTDPSAVPGRDLAKEPEKSSGSESAGTEKSEPEKPFVTDARMMLDKLKFIPLDRDSLREEKSLARLAAQNRAGTRPSSSDQSRWQIVRGMLIHDLPTSISDYGGAAEPKNKEPAKRTDFAFVASDQKDRGALATLKFVQSDRNKLNSLSVYFFDLANQDLWTKQIQSLNSDYVMGSAPSSQYFLLSSATHGHIKNDDCWLINSEEFNKKNVDRQQDLELPGTMLQLAPGTQIAPPFSADGKWYARIKSDSGNERNPPGVSVRQISGDTDQFKSKELSFEGVLSDSKPEWKLAGMTFDREAHWLVAGFEGKPYLFAFLLTEATGEGERKAIHPKPITLPGPPRAWAHRPDGNRIAVVSKDSILIQDLMALDPRKTETARSEDSLKKVTSVAFGPKGRVLATGDLDGVITIRSLTVADDAKEKVSIDFIMRLKHVGQIRKLGFSPDGRILAALALPQSAPKDDAASGWSWIRNWDRPGLIRLWITDGWEPVDPPQDGTGAAVAPDAK